MKRFLVTALSALFVFTLAGCGGGGSSNGGTSDGGTSNGGTTNPVTNPVTYKLSIQGPISSTDVKGLEFELVLPAGMTLKYDPKTNFPLPGIVETSPSISTSQPLFASIFSPPSSALDVGILKVGLITITGIGPGEFATVTCDVLPGSPVPEVRNVKVTDRNTVTLDGVNVLIDN